MALNEVEKKLAEYRAKKQREALINYYTLEMKNTFTKFLKKKEDKNEENESENESKENLLTSVDDPNSEAESFDDPHSNSEENSSLTIFDYVQYCLWFMLWFTVYMIFIKLEFGIIYLILSALIGMYLNTRTRPKKRNEVSAYSVFNKNCESIDGTLNADKLTREMLYGGFSR